MSKQFYYRVYEVQISKLVDDFIRLVKSISKENTNLSYEEILKDFIDFKTKIKLEIAFVGQYAAGKSTIISALTGNKKIKIGQGITTDAAKPYPWSDDEKENNVYLIDTPGIYTERKEHDEISIAYMNKADLLVYVITVDGFVDPIGPNFRKIAFDNGLSNKMMLVINKRSMESEQNKENWVKHVITVIEPLSPEELKLVIIDAKDFIEGLDSQDIQEKDELIKLSNFENFIAKLNEFIKEKGLLGKITSPLNLINFHSNKLIDQITSINPDFEKLQEILRRKQFVVLKNKQKLDDKIRSEINVLHSEIIKKGFQIAQMIGYESEQEIIKQENDKVVEEVEELCDETKSKIKEMATKEIENLLEEIKKLSESSLMKDLLGVKEFKLDYKIEIKDTRIKESFKQAPEALKNFSSFAKSFSTNAEKVGGSGLKVLSGSGAHKTVLKIGEMLGHKFKPWEAVKYADKLAKVGKVAGIAGLLLGPAIAWWEEIQDKKYKENLLKTRMSIRNNYSDYAKEIKKEFEEKLKELFENIHDVELNSIDEQIRNLRSSEKNELDEVINLKEINQESMKLLEKIGNS